MEDLRTLRIPLILVFGGTLLLFPLFVFGYDDKTTHPAITQEIIKFFNSNFQDLNISNEDAEYIIQGSMDEDSGTRWMYHFYDPVYNRGLVLNNEGFPNNKELAVIGAEAKSEWHSSKEWAQSSELQGGILESLIAGIFQDLFSGSNNYSWERAIYEYTWGDKKLGLESLGHVLHLLEDASVPDHTRNDPHPPILDFGSPYEAWTKKFDRRSFYFTADEKPIILPDLNFHFDTLASYSNNHFFSKDTILSKKYSTPRIVEKRTEGFSDGQTYLLGYGTDRFGSLIRLVQIKRRSWSEPEYSLRDNDDLILSDYWSLLSKQAVLHGAGVIKLFFDEAEEEKQTKTLYGKNKSWLGKQVDKLKNYFGFAHVSQPFTQIPITQAPTQESPKVIEKPIIPPLPTPPPQVSALKPKPSEPTQTQKIEPNPHVLAAAIILTNQPEPPQKEEINWQIVGGGSFPSEPRREDPNPTKQNPESKIESDTISPATPTILSPSEGQKIATTTVIFSGNAEPQSTISQNFSTSTAKTDVTGTWTLSLEKFFQGSTTIKFFAKDSAGNISSESTRTIFIDSSAPNISLEINECKQSLSPTTCLLIEPEINLHWESDASDFSHYFVSCQTKNEPCENFEDGITSDTEMTYEIPTENDIYIFKVRAVDTNGNSSPEQIKEVEITKKPVVINEIGWMGTSATRSEDEWIELYNPTDQTIDLSNMKLRAEDGTPIINFPPSSTIGPKNYYLIERKNSGEKDEVTQSSIIDIVADLWISFSTGLENNGEVLTLEYKGEILDETPPIEDCAGWCHGSAISYVTMERYDPLKSGSDPANWASGGGVVTNGKNADGLPILGTPRKKNSHNYLIDRSTTLSENKTLKKSSSPYIVNTYFSIPHNRTLTIEPGVVIKFTSQTALDVEGNIIAQGNNESPIVFTSFKDDSYAGDTNEDGASSSPKPGDWHFIKLRKSGSILDNIIARFGGIKDLSSQGWAILRVDNASTTIKNSIIEESGAYGMWLANMSGNIESNIIRKNSIHGNIDSTGIVLTITATTSPLTIKNNLFGENAYGLRAIGTGPQHDLTISENTFTKNSRVALSIAGVYPSLSKNNASLNGINGTTIDGTIIQDYTLAPDLPYVITNLSVPSTKTLTLDPGVIIKFASLGSIDVSGTMKSLGNSLKKIIFTSLHDDDCAIGGCGDTNNSTTTPQTGDWSRIKFLPGSDNSAIQHTIVRYGGTKNQFDPKRGALIIEGASININNTMVEKNYSGGIRLEYSTTTSITNSTIKDHRDPIPESVPGIFLLHSSIAAKDILFENNSVGIHALGSSTIINNGGIIFTSNNLNTIPSDLIP